MENLCKENIVLLHILLAVFKNSTSAPFSLLIPKGGLVIIKSKNLFNLFQSLNWFTSAWIICILSSNSKFSTLFLAIFNASSSISNKKTFWQPDNAAEIPNIPVPQPKSAIVEFSRG